jgi:hypothetical protein
MFVWGIFGNELSGQKIEAFHADCINRTVKFPKGVTIWGCMSAKDLGNFEFIDRIVNAEKYHKILTNGLLSSINKLYAEENFIFQQDRAKSTQKWLSEKESSSSPDLNIIETLWHKMKQQHIQQQ